MFRDALLVISLSLGLAGAADAARKASSTPSCAPACAPVKAAAKTPVARRAKPAAGAKLYTARVTSQTPLAVGIVVDQSGSNRHPVSGTDMPMSKAQALSNAVNANLEAMVAASVEDEVDEDTQEPKFKPWFRVAGVGYSKGIRPLLGDKVAFVTTGELAKSAKWLDSNGQPAKKPEDYHQMHWVEPVAQGYTHMAEGFAELVPLFEQFVKDHPDAPAPIVMHFNDGKPDGGSMQHIAQAEKLRSLKTKDGNLILFNVHVGVGGGSYMFPTKKTIEKLPMEMRADARRLFEMSSPLPPAMLAKAQAMFPEFEIEEGARAMVYNATGGMLAQLLEMGTVQNMKARK